MSSWAAELAEALCGGQNDSETRIMIATVAGVSPFSIRVFGETISRQLHVHPALLFGAELSDGQIDQIFQYDGSSTPAWLAFLKGFHKGYVIRAGDQVAVLQVGADFYVLEVVA